MIGLILVSVGEFFHELGLSIGKFEIAHRKETIPVMGFLSFFWTLIFLLLIGVIRSDFIFNALSLPTLGIKIILEIAQIHIGLIALTKTSRSTITFITVGTIPLLLLVDYLLGYEMILTQILGIMVIVIGLLIIFINHGLNSKGIGYVIFITINAVATISLYKYNINNFNSVSAEQSITILFLLIYFFSLSMLKDKVNPFVYMKKPLFLFQSIILGICSTLINFAYLFGSASVITTAKRALSIVGAMISGNLYFKEKKLIIKITTFFIILIGLILLVMK